jgi:hypothetical protein
MATTHAGGLVAELSRRAAEEGGNTGAWPGLIISEFRSRFGVTPRTYGDAHALHRELRVQRDDPADAPAIQQDADII